MSRKFFVGGNWKMNGDLKYIDEAVELLSKAPLDPNVGTYNTSMVITERCVGSQTSYTVSYFLSRHYHDCRGSHRSSSYLFTMYEM
jgi:triosephosphate isomerase